MTHGDDFKNYVADQIREVERDLEYQTTQLGETQKGIELFSWFEKTTPKTHELFDYVKKRLEDLRDDAIYRISKIEEAKMMLTVLESRLPDDGPLKE